MPRPLLVTIWCKEHEADIWADDYLRRDASRGGYVYEFQGLKCEGEDCRDRWEIKEVKTG